MRPIKLTAIAALLMATPALANTPLQDEAIRALRAAHDEPNGTIYEHGGMILVNSGTMRYVEPHPDNDKPTSVFVSDRGMLLQGDMLVATYHTHPCIRGYFHAYFSPPDIWVQIISGVPEFILDECDGSVHEFFYRYVDKVFETGIDITYHNDKCELQKGHLPTGRIVGNIGIVEPEHTIDDGAERNRCKPK